MEPPYAIGIDLGGTRVKLAAVSEDGMVLERSAIGTWASAERHWTEGIREALCDLATRQGRAPHWIGVGAPGLAAADRRSIASHRGRFADLEGLRWDEALRAGARVVVTNDAHAALLAEAWKGAAQGCRDAFLLTLGTGVGGAILSDRRVVHGHLGRAGHLGHICLDPDGPPTATSGMPGALEDAIGNQTLARRSEGHFTDTREMVAAHLAGDADASAVWLRSVRLLACGIASLVNVLDPEVVVLGGGIAQAGPALFEPLAREMATVEWRPLGKGVRIVPAALGDIAGALGAACAAMHGGLPE